MRKLVILSVLSVLLALSSTSLAEEERREGAKESQTYESPVLSLLLLPVTVLIRMASVFEPAGGAGKAAPRPSSPDTPAK